MRIKRIDLCGFKSFCDRTSIDLRARINAIVGPNGCGKSNIVDALMWAMGEQRARHLRGKSMEDVIFNGSDARGPAGLAEIAVTFENDGRVPPEYINYSEITVTRRLHRDGTSEYLINKLPVRLRDVTNLFLGTGVGTKAYSIIEQGRVGLIVSAKPEERRHLLEEAAGITKYRRRKQAAERKMEAARYNLLRVSDILEEVGKRRGSLRRQAQKAERYRRYKTEMRDIELWSLSQRMLGLIVEEQVLSAEQRDLDERRQQAEHALHRRELDLESARLGAMEQERRLNEQQEELYQLDNKIQLAESQITFQGREAEQLQERGEQSQQEVEGLREQLVAARQQHDVVEAQASQHAVRREALRGEAELCGENLAALREELAEVERAVEHERAAVVQAERTSTRAEADLRALAHRRNDLRERIDQRRDEATQVIARLATLRATGAALDGELDQLRDELRALEDRRTTTSSRLEQLRGEAERGEAELEVLRTELHRRRSRLTSLQELHTRYEGFGRGTRAIMQRHNGSSRERGILGVVADMVEAPPRYETALEAVLGQRLGTIVVEDNSVGMDAIRFLKQNRQGRGTFIARQARRGLLDSAPVGVVWAAGGGGAGEQQASAGGGPVEPALQAGGVHGPMLQIVGFSGEYRQVAETLLSDVVVVEDLERATALWDRVENTTLVTIDGEILEPDGTVTGGSHDAELSGVLRQKREIKELSAIIEDLELQYRESLDAHVQVRTEIAKLEQAMADATQDGHRSDKEILTREKDLGRVRSEGEALAERRGELDHEIERLSQQGERMEQQQQELAQEMEDAVAEQRLGSDILQLLGRERARMLDVIEGASLALTDARVELAQAEANCDASQDALYQLRQLCEEREQRIERLEREREEGQLRAQQLRSNVNRLREELEQLVTDRAGQQQTIAEGRMRYEERVAALGELELALKETREEVSQLGVDAGKVELRRSELRMTQQHIEEQVWERYREPLRAVLGDFHLRPLIGEEQLQRLEKLRQLVERMGEINLTAIDEYNELSERFEFLTEQKGDLELALKQLQRAIQKINRTCRKRFIETFDLVNAKFQEVFPRLFRGGRARLLLTEADDVLQGGVDIVAQPPGKKLVSIEMMSGGEKALTATSLIFAMFLVRPTPFCLLDEVDAPLDEANVVRFREMVREMSEGSQFILITHNRNTMEIADRLFGVTMEDPGISKLVSVNLAEAQAVAA